MASATTPVLFPTLGDARWAYTNLAAEARSDPEVSDLSPNPLNDPDFCRRWVEADARRKGVDFTYGGYMEPRDHLWRGHYHHPDLMRHTAVDYNVPAGTPVTAPAKGRVLWVVRDPSFGGWGGCVFIALANPYLGADYYLMAHLAHAGLPSAGDILPRGSQLGFIGEPHENGVWFPHLHLQCFDQTIYDRYAPTLDDMDGYGPNQEVINSHMPDPTALGAGLHR
ncbi:peptidoglycan DD-metalloendopeptidase family protein [Hyphomicrobium sp. LHD-15]|uniref:peptidoglycan DD-metalloendopeptidase family protein n=1 Tax=Hyphomicrobium sp. LHD-15 TaxID=3072142 RepID=UPI00280E0127|nr:peptidoglycan DD-metalloendopeptidase family protein [Hyphomicrobium sp. LHD-15]MDQ8698593.1 peptidoglycan DD-metalloendopeptidase family protein [Hyphomicrobium sp. LHD-15]